jgi:hypothetical protein
MYVCAAPREALGAVDDHLVAVKRDADQPGLRSRLAAAHAAALRDRRYEVGSSASTLPSGSAASG